MTATAAVMAVGVGVQLYANKKAAEESARASAAAETQARYNAQATKLQAAFDKKRVLEDASNVQSEQRVAIAKSGVAATGSAARVMRETYDLALADIEAIKVGAGIRSTEYLMAAEEEKRARRAQAKGYLLTQAGTLLTGAGAVMANWKQPPGGTQTTQKPSNGETQDLYWKGKK